MEAVLFGQMGLLSPFQGAPDGKKCKSHMRMAPACERVKFCSGDLVGRGHMSGPFARRIWPLCPLTRRL